MNSETCDGTLYLSGDITVKTVTAAAFAGFGRQCRLKDIRILDLAEVGRADSACVSLLLTALRANGSLEIRNLPQSVQALAELYEIREWVHS